MFTFEELTTLLCQIAACLNSRPLTPISNDPEDMAVLTPGHFMIGQPIITPYEAPINDVPMNRLSAWEKIQKLHQEFWIRWPQEYINEQQKRNKWAIPVEPLRLNDLVLIKDELLPPCHWPLGRITEVYPGKDKQIHTCKVKTNKTELIRPVDKLIRLPIEQTMSGSGFP